MEGSVDIYLILPGHSKITLTARHKSQFVSQILLAAPQPSNQKEFALLALLDLIKEAKKLKPSEATTETLRWQLFLLWKGHWLWQWINYSTMECRKGPGKKKRRRRAYNMHHRGMSIAQVFLS